jgi:hypothetical protein
MRVGINPTPTRNSLGSKNVGAGLIPARIESRVREYKMLKHVVFFKFKDGVGEKEILGLEKGFAELPPVIPEVLSYEFGRDVVRSERSYDLALVSSFKDLQSMQRYQKHPAHQIVSKKVNELCESVLAVDFVTK